jgi:hypothetical protein
VGLFGGSSQSTSSSSNVLDFAPIFNIGDGIESTQRKELAQTTSTSPKLDDSFGLSASVGVGVGGDGSGGTASLQRSQVEDTQPLTTKSVQEQEKSSNLLLIGGLVVAGLGGAIYYFNKKA